MDYLSHNRRAWDQQVEDGDAFTVPVTPDVIQAARHGDWRIYLTPTRPIPLDWFPLLQGRDVLCLASGGGQQGPVLAAVGALVTVFDNSQKQLQQDRMVAEREGLDIRTVLGDMADLSAFEDSSFDLIVHPVSNVFVPHVIPVWMEAYRLLRPGGLLMAGFMNPVFYLFDREPLDNEGILTVRHRLPYSDLTSQTKEELQKQVEAGWPLEWGHSLEDQIGGQIRVGFSINGFYEDYDLRSSLSQYTPLYMATRAVKRTE